MITEDPQIIRLQFITSVSLAVTRRKWSPVMAWAIVIAEESISKLGNLIPPIRRNGTKNETVFTTIFVIHFLAIEPPPTKRNREMSEQKAVTKSDEGQVSVITTPDSLIERAIDNGADVDSLGKLLDLKERYEAEEAKKAFNKAMAQFQPLKPTLPRTKAVRFGSNSQAAYKYCPLDTMEMLLRNPLAECGLSYSWQGVSKEGMDGQRCIIKHVMGHSEVTDMFAPADDSGNKNSIQSIGSTATYLQRYTLKAALGLVEVDEDDDGVNSGDMPYIKLIEHNHFIFANMPKFLEIRKALASDDFEKAVEVLYAFTQEQLTSVWIAPSKGGFFTTQEVQKIRSDEFIAVRDQYFAEKNEA